MDEVHKIYLLYWSRWEVVRMNGGQTVGDFNIRDWCWHPDSRLWLDLSNSSTLVNFSEGKIVVSGEYC